MLSFFDISDLYLRDRGLYQVTYKLEVSPLRDVIESGKDRVQRRAVVYRASTSSKIATSNNSVSRMV